MMMADMLYLSYISIVQYHSYTVLRLERSTSGREQRSEISSTGNNELGPFVADTILRERWNWVRL